jgi:FixJ family two-component response regulator
MSDPAYEGLTVFIIEDDAAMRDSLSLMLGLLDFRVITFKTAEAFLETYRDNWAGCVVADLALPGMTGVEVQAELKSRGSTLPFVIITGHGDVQSARAAFQLDAVDFIEKPFAEAALRAAIERGLERESSRLRAATAGSELAQKLGRLTRRECEVLELVGRGLHAKEIASALDISTRTVEVHKSHLMTKLDVRNVSELVRIALASERNQGP